MNAKEFRKIIALPIDRSRLLGTKRFADGRMRIVNLIHTRNRIAMFMDPTRWRHRKLPPWRKTLPVAGDGGWLVGRRRRRRRVTSQTRPGTLRKNVVMTTTADATVVVVVAVPRLRQCQGKTIRKKNHRAETKKM